MEGDIRVDLEGVQDCDGGAEVAGELGGDAGGVVAVYDDGFVAEREGGVFEEGGGCGGEEGSASESVGEEGRGVQEGCDV